MAKLIDLQRIATETLNLYLSFSQTAMNQIFTSIYDTMHTPHLPHSSNNLCNIYILSIVVVHPSSSEHSIFVFIHINIFLV